MGEGGVKKFRKIADVVYGWSLSQKYMAFYNPLNICQLILGDVYYHSGIAILEFS